MTLQLLRGRWWKIVCPPYGAFCHFHKGIIPEQYVAFCQPQPILGGAVYLETTHGLDFKTTTFPCHVIYIRCRLYKESSYTQINFCML